LCIIIQHILGSALGPPVIGAFSDAFGLETAMVFLPAFAALAGVLFFIGSFFYDADAKLVDGMETQK